MADMGVFGQNGIDRIGSYYEKPLLTSHQYKILNAAFKKGFYKIPRQINKTELAEQFGVSKSAISESIRRIHKRLVEKYLQTE
ncbi:MAG: hypothetical protein GF364_21990 [Candidatus Lokiarchaeota archaeon]|nr:hypothetical protein [Candidatus Lokiarchaeota archaeon]